MDRVEEFTAAEGILERIAFAIFSHILIFSIVNFDGITAEVAEHSEEVFR